jgi:chemotaxis protein MotB
MKGEETKAQELLIIRRSSGGEEGGHHGGVWKIAYADFMTAMMAFFLVMWLINSTDKKTLTQVGGPQDSGRCPQGRAGRRPRDR